MFQFNTDKFDYNKIYEAIKHVYPIGIRREQKNMYFSYAGLKELEDILVDNIHNGNHFTEKWVNFTKQIEKQIDKEIIGTTLGQAPSFSSYVLLNTTSLNDLTRTKELHFFVSLVGPFYTIIGQDITVIKINEHKTFTNTNYLVVSPESEFASIFEQLCNQIETQFKSYRFVPFDICKQTIEGLYVYYSDENLHAVFNALFNDQIDLSIDRTLGNSFYKSENWIKDNYVDTQGSGWTAYPPKS